MEDKLFQRILVPTDGSEHSIAAARLAIRIAGAFGSAIGFLFVVDVFIADELARFTKMPAAEARRDLAENGLNYLNYLERLALDEGVSTTKILREGTPHLEILATAQELGSDLIVMGRVGRKGLKLITMGSVTERVIAGAECPVMITRAK